MSRSDLRIRFIAPTLGGETLAVQIRILVAMLFLSTPLILPIKMAFAKPLYVSTAGNDRINRDANDIDNPWLTPKHAWLNTKAGDTVYFRGGTYSVTSPIDTLTGHYGTANQPILFKNFQNEPVVFLGSPGVSPLLSVNKSYHYIEGIRFVGQGGIIIWVGDTLISTNFHARNCELFIKSAENTSNISAIRLQSTRANNAFISNCKFKSASTSFVRGIQVFRTQGFVIENCEFENLSVGVDIKHSNSLEDTGISISKNYFYNCVWGVGSVGNYVLIDNNLFVGCGIGFGGDGGMGDGYVGCDYNTVTHNTIYDGQFQIIYETREEDPNKGCLWNTIKNNVFSKICRWHPYHYFPNAHLASDYNLYPPGDIVRENKINYSLPGWRIHNRSDAHSISGIPKYRGGSGPRSPLHYSLNPSSVGYKGVSDGRDLGADMSRVGILRPLNLGQ